MAKLGKVNTATLVRGRNYSMRIPKHMLTGEPDEEPTVKFEKSVPVEISNDRFLAYLEKQIDGVVDGDGEEYEKPRFLIHRNVDPLESDNSEQPTRLRADRTVRVSKAPISAIRRRRLDA